MSWAVAAAGRRARCAGVLLAVVLGGALAEPVLAERSGGGLRAFPRQAPHQNEAVPGMPGPLGAVDWRNHAFDVECGAAAELLTLSGGRWADPELHDPAAGSFRALLFEGATVLPGHDDIVAVHLSCLAGGAGARQSSTTLAFVRVDAAGGAEQLGAVTVPPTRDITVGDDGTIVVGYAHYLGDEPLCCPAGYATVMVSWADGAPVLHEAQQAPVPAADELSQRVGLGSLDDPLAGLTATPPTVHVDAPGELTDPSACTHVELAPGFGDPFTNGLLQLALERRGFPTGSDRGDGEFGAATHAALVGWVEANRTALARFTGGDDTAIDEALSTGAVRLPLLDALGIGCAAGVLPLETLTADGETGANDW